MVCPILPDVLLSHSIISPSPSSLHENSQLMICGWYLIITACFFHVNNPPAAPPCVPNTNIHQKVTCIKTCSAKLRPHLTKNNKSHSPWLRTEDAYPPLFFRKLPGSRNVYAQMHNEKEQEMTSPVNHSEDTQHIIQGEEFIDDDLDSQTLGNAGGSPAFRSLIRTTTNHCY